MLSRNLALDNSRDHALGGGVTAEDNSWNQTGWTGAVLRATDEASAQAPRSPDGALPSTTFLTNSRDPAIGAPMAPRR